MSVEQPGDPLPPITASYSRWRKPVKERKRDEQAEQVALLLAWVQGTAAARPPERAVPGEAALPNKPRVPYSTGKLVYTAIPRNHGFSLAAALGEPSQMHDPFEKQLVGLCQDEADRAAVKADKVKKRGQPAAAKCRKADENDSPRPDNVPAKRRRKRVAKKGSDMDGVNSP
ncbi:hypothetical protein WJX72_006383 [[Myrmecia] bisecta]|uniref:Uncharacterized protein n=1 Tax=[Myrmecia] bisecta TaxID=41462 RepID=A0AAW1QFI9_9CHLO